MMGLEIKSVFFSTFDLYIDVYPHSQTAFFQITQKQIRSGELDRIFDNWLPGAGLEPDNNYFILRYDSDPLSFSMNMIHEIDCLVPVKPLTYKPFNDLSQSPLSFESAYL